MDWSTSWPWEHLQNLVTLRFSLTVCGKDTGTGDNAQSPSRVWELTLLARVGIKRPHTQCEVEWQVPTVHTQLPRRLPGRAFLKPRHCTQEENYSLPETSQPSGEPQEFTAARTHTIWEIRNLKLRISFSLLSSSWCRLADRPEPVCNFSGGALRRPRSLGIYSFKECVLSLQSHKTQN